MVEQPIKQRGGDEDLRPCKPTNRPPKRGNLSSFRVLAISPSPDHLGRSRAAL
jgi:hypothetical protein